MISIAVLVVGLTPCVRHTEDTRAFGGNSKCLAGSRELLSKIFISPIYLLLQGNRAPQLSSIFSVLNIESIWSLTKKFFDTQTSYFEFHILQIVPLYPFRHFISSPVSIIWDLMDLIISYQDHEIYKWINRRSWIKMFFLTLSY